MIHLHNLLILAVFHKIFHNFYDTKLNKKIRKKNHGMFLFHREVTSGQQLDEVDISVHCDIKIFEWLMCWILYDNIEV